jgi:hypothetical protein
VVVRMGQCRLCSLVHAERSKSNTETRSKAISMDSGQFD